MTRAELLSNTRTVIDDTVTPYGWSDAFILNALAEGQDRFCEKTGYFVDKSTFSVATEEGVTDYVLDPRIIEVKEVWDGARRLQEFTQAKRPSSQGVVAEPSSPVHWQVDGETGMLTLFESPIGGVELTIRAWRYAKKALNHKTADAYDAEPEIPASFHWGLIEFAAGKAFEVHDRERQDPVKARDHMANFEQYCADGKRAFDRLTRAQSYVDVNPFYTFS